MRDVKALRRNRMRNTTTRPLFVGIPDAVLSRIVSLVHELLVRDERNADEFADEDEYYWEYVKDEAYDGCDENPSWSRWAKLLPHLGSVSRGWRRVAIITMVRDQEAWLSVPSVKIAAECLSAFPTAHSLRIYIKRDAWPRTGDIATVLASRAVTRLSLNWEWRSADWERRSDGPCSAPRTLAFEQGCGRLDSLVGLRSLYIRDCKLLTDLRRLSALAGLRTLKLIGCRDLTNVRPLSALINLYTLTLQCA